MIGVCDHATIRARFQLSLTSPLVPFRIYPNKQPNMEVLKRSADTAADPETHKVSILTGQFYKTC
jgi:hypothetical protein